MSVRYNWGRTPLSPEERARARYLCVARGMTTYEAADEMGRSQAAVATAVRGLRKWTPRAPDYERARQVVTAYEDAISGRAGTVEGLVERYGYRSARSLSGSIRHYRRMLAAQAAQKREAA